PPLRRRADTAVPESLRRYDLTVRESGRRGFDGIVQGERALARLAHGHSGEESLDEIYERPGAFHRPYLAGEEIPSGADGGQGSLTQADVTPGEEPTKKPGGGA